MKTWEFLPTRPLSVVHARALPDERECYACKGVLMRLAERSLTYPYAWHPNGYICSKCNVCYIEV